MTLSETTSRRVWKMYRDLLNGTEPETVVTQHFKTIEGVTDPYLRKLYSRFNSNNGNRVKKGYPEISLEEYLYRKDNNINLIKDINPYVEINKNAFTVMNTSRRKKGLAELTLEEYTYRKQNNYNFTF